MAMIKVKFDYPVYENGINYAAGESVPMSEKRLKAYPKNEYTIIKEAKIKKGKKTKDIPIEDKETSDVILRKDDFSTE